jgi:hypothetical protein
MYVCSTTAGDVVARRVTLALVLTAWSISGGRESAAAIVDPEPQTAQSVGRLEVIVLDPSDALLVSAEVEIRRDGGQVRTWQRLILDGDRWIAEGLDAGSYSLRVNAPGFQPQTLASVEVRRGTTRRTVRLAIETLQATVVVERSPRDAALDPRGFSTFLSREQIAALPDDPAALERALREMAPPGAVLRIDGFTGGVMPSKAHILSIRIPRLDALAAEDHGGLNPFSVIDIVTSPGTGRLQGTAGLMTGGSTLNARNPLAASKTPAATTVGDLAIDGPLRRDRMSFAATFRASSESDTATVRAVLPEQPMYAREVARPTTDVTVAGRFLTALGSAQTLRSSFAVDARSVRNAGVGEYNLEERAYDSSFLERTLRLSIGGPWGARRNVDSRLQLRWSGSRNSSRVEAPTVQVLDAFTSGGAQATGGERAFGIQGASDIDYARGAHAWRVGVLVDGDHHAASRPSNYEGTYVFTSLDAFESGQPSFFTRRFGDARVRYMDLQLGAYLQDDYRASRSVLLSYGVRTEWQNLLSNPPAVLPRAGITWSPRRRGTPTLRASWGVVREWFPDSVYEQSLLVDGRRQFDVRLAEPSFPGPTDSGSATSPESFRLANGLPAPHGYALVLGIEHQVSSSLRLFASSSLREGRGLLRGHNLNPAVDGHRPDETMGNVIETRGDAGLHGRTLTVQSIYSSPFRRVDASASYLLNRSTSNTAGAFWTPPSGDDLRGEWGPMTATHAATGSVSGRTHGLVATLTGYWRSGTPYTVTLATPTEDGFFVARPAGTRRNSAHTPSQAAAGARVAYAIGFGTRQPPVLSAVQAGQSMSATTPGAGPESRRFRLEFQASAQNLTNRPNYLAVGNVVGSPLFGHPVSAAAPRTIDLGVRFWF